MLRLEINGVERVSALLVHVGEDLPEGVVTGISYSGGVYHITVTPHAEEPKTKPKTKARPSAT